MKSYFELLSKQLFARLQVKESLILNFKGDHSEFIRLSESKVRQVGTVENFFLEYALLLGEKEGELKQATGQLTLSLELESDVNALEQEFTRMREAFRTLPVDPYAELPKDASPSDTKVLGSLLHFGEFHEKVLPHLSGLDVAGLYSSGIIVRGMAHSRGLFHWFETDRFSFDYSLFTPDRRAIKSGYAGLKWNQEDFFFSLNRAKAHLEPMQRAPVTLKPGKYRTYLGPSAVEDLVAMFSWGAVSELAIRKNQSALRLLRSGEKSFSPKFSLFEDFTEGTNPRFNEEGAVSRERFALIDGGKLKETLIGARSALEFKLTSNAASSSEGMRAPRVGTGQLKEEEILKELGTGLYLSNLHYLNWSDSIHGRITGMTRYACFWVENGEIVAPIQNLRFDDTLFDLFGSELVDFTDFDESLSVNDTYDYRKLGGMIVPGMLLKGMNFTL